jgi:hypothetical protein
MRHGRSAARDHTKSWRRRRRQGGVAVAVSAAIGANAAPRTNAIAAYAYSNGAAITGQLISVESAIVAGEPIVIARARLRDPLHRLRDGELVGVAIQLRK